MKKEDLNLDLIRGLTWNPYEKSHALNVWVMCDTSAYVTRLMSSKPFHAENTTDNAFYIEK